MADWFPNDPEEIVAGLREQNEQIVAAARRARLDVVESCEQALATLADSAAKLAESSEIEWVSRYLRAQAELTREIAEATGKFAREALGSQ